MEDQGLASARKFLVLHPALLLSQMKEQKRPVSQAARMLAMRRAQKAEQDLTNMLWANKMVPLQRQLAARASLRAIPNRTSRKTNLTKTALMRLRRACSLLLALD
jgi:hypothetical protein